jgi:hypothetical protein
MKSVFLIIILNALLPVLAFGQFNTPKYSNEFLNLGVGARAIGMGKAQTSIANDVTAAYWNPSLLPWNKENHQLILMHASYFGGIANFDYGSFSMAIDSSGRLAVSLIRFGIDDIPDTRFLYDANGRINYDNIRYFSAADYAALVSYGRKLNFIKGLSAGASFKIVHRIAGEFANAWGFGIDAGLHYRRKNLFLGLMLQDISGTFNAWSHDLEMVRDIYQETGNEIPQNSIEVTLPKMIIGFAYEFELNHFEITPTIDLISTFDGKRNTVLKSGFYAFDPRIGVEIGFMKTAFFRSGVANIQKKNLTGDSRWIIEPDFGVGFRIKNLKIDYALSNQGGLENSGYSHLFSILYSF